MEISKLFKFTVHQTGLSKKDKLFCISKLFKFTVHEKIIKSFLAFLCISKLFKFTVHKNGSKKIKLIFLISKLFMFTVHIRKFDFGSYEISFQNFSSLQFIFFKFFPTFWKNNFKTFQVYSSWENISWIRYSQ